MMRPVPRMGTRLGPRPQRTVVPDTVCTCGGCRPDGQRDSSQGYVAAASLSDSEKGGRTLTGGVRFRRTWSSDGDAAAAAVESPSSSCSSSSSELSPRDQRTCLPGSTTADPGSGSGQGGSSAAARRLAYEQFARVMYTNRANLQHTIAVQQRLFQQQLGHQTALGPPPLPPRPGQKVNEERSDGDGQLEWVVRRRADGTRYITRRPASSRHRTRRAHDVKQLTSRDVTSSPAERKDAAAGKPERTGGKAEGSLRVMGSRQGVAKETCAVTVDSVPERTKELCRAVTGKSTTAFHNIPLTSLKPAYQHPILAVITI